MRHLAVLCVLVACGPGSRNGSGDPDAAHPVDTNPTSDTGATPTASRVYAHNGTTLYRVDTTTFAPVMVGPMTALTMSLTDLAIDKNDQMVGITLNSLYSIDSTTAAVTLIKNLSASASGFTSLSYVPSNLDDPSSTDILVSANDQGDVYQIDPATGNATKLGSYGTVAGGKVVSSGDLIGVRGVGIYATVDVGTGTGDYLAKIDPATWKATPLGTGTGYDQIFGLGYWAGTIYGFTKGGDILKIDPNTGAGTKLNSGAVQWYGAGVSTDAPIIF